MKRSARTEGPVHIKCILKKLEADERLEWVGPCVICGGSTSTQKTGRHDRQAVYVHALHESTLGCALVYDYQQEQLIACDKKRVAQEYALEQGVSVRVALDELGFLLDEMPEENADYFNYDSYIHSIQWKIKAERAKYHARWTCQRCKAKFRIGSSQLHAHHKHYRTLYRERPQDIEVLCAHCHRKEHGLVEELPY